MYFGCLCVGVMLMLGSVGGFLAAARRCSDLWFPPVRNLEVENRSVMMETF